MANENDQDDIQPNAGKEKVTRKKATTRKKAAPRKKTVTREKATTKKKTTVAPAATITDSPAPKPLPLGTGSETGSPDSARTEPIGSVSAPAAEKDMEESKKEQLSAKMEDMGLMPTNNTSPSPETPEAPAAQNKPAKGSPLKSALLWLGLLVLVGGITFLFFQEPRRTQTPDGKQETPDAQAKSPAGASNEPERPVTADKVPLSEDGKGKDEHLEAAANTEEGVPPAAPQSDDATPPSDPGAAAESVVEAKSAARVTDIRPEATTLPPQSQGPLTEEKDSGTAQGSSAQEANAETAIQENASAPVTDPTAGPATAKALQSGGETDEGEAVEGKAVENGKTAAPVTGKPQARQPYYPYRPPFAPPPGYGYPRQPHPYHRPGQ